MKQNTTTWESTGTPGLYIRRPGETFYARVAVNGKRTWRSLETDKLRKAQALLRDLQSGRTREVSTRSDDRLHAAMGSVIEFRSVRRGIDRPLKSQSIKYHGEILKAARAMFDDRPLGTFAKEHILKTIQGSNYSQSRRKAIFELLKRTFADAVENGTIKRNPLAGHVPGKVRKKERTLPMRAQLDELAATIAELYPRYGHRSVLTLRLLAFSGMRITEARSLKWADVGPDTITIRGTEDEGTKTGTIRKLDINAPLRAVLDEISANYGKTDKPLMPGKSILNQLKNACEKMKVPTINHHDLRSWFITWSISSGVNIATLADWVGNSPTVLLERYAAMQGDERRAAATKML